MTIEQVVRRLRLVAGNLALAGGCRMEFSLRCRENCGAQSLGPAMDYPSGDGQAAEQRNPRPTGGLPRPKWCASGTRFGQGCMFAHVFPSIPCTYLNAYHYGYVLVAVDLQIQ